MKVLLVDDEKHVREGISENLNWLEIGVSVCVTCANGKIAYEKAKTFRPDILVTDIRMPVMDGIDLAQKIHQEFPRCKIIFMSGFSDKEYLFAAMRLKAVDYVEKPIKLEQLAAVIGGAVAEIKQEGELYQKNRMWSSMKPLLRSEMALLLIKPRPDLEELRGKAHVVGLDSMISENIITAVFWINALNDFPDGFNAELNRLSEIHNISTLFAQKGDESFIIQFLSRDEHKLNISIVCGICMDIITLFDTSWMIALGTAEPVERAYCSYSNAVVNMETAFYRGYNSIILPDDKPLVYEFDNEMITELEQAILEKDKERAVQLVKRLAMRLKTHSGTFVSTTKNFLYRLFIALDKAAAEMSEWDGKGDTEDVLNFIMESHTLDEIVARLLAKIDLVYGQMNVDAENNNVWRIKQYIKKNYGNQALSIYEIASYVGLNISYVNVLFRKATGISINEYVTQYRIAEAEKMLMQPNIPIKEIAVRVGYQSSNYFSKVFKKAKGILPKEYRRKYIR